MFSLVLAFQFLYFPEDKTAYIPAVITLIIFSLAYVVFTIFRKISKREEKKAKELEEKLKISMHGKNS